MSLLINRMTVTQTTVLVRVVNRLAGFGMSFLGVRLATGTPLTAAQVATVLALFGACTVPSRLLGGILALRIGARGAITVGLTVAGAALIGIALSRSSAVLVAAVLTLGLAYEIVEPATQSVVADDPGTGPPAARFALLWSAMSVAGVLSGLVAAVLSRWGVTALFLVDGCSGLGAAAIAWIRLPRHAHGRRGDPPDARRLRDAATPRLLAWTAAATPYAVLVMIVVLLLPLALVQDRQPPWLAGLMMAASATAAVATQRWMARRRRPARTRTDLAAGHLVFAAGVAVWVLGDLAAYLLGAAMEGAAGSVLIGTYQAQAAARGRPGSSAGTMAVFGLSWGAATVLAPLVGSPLLHLGADVLWCAVAVCSTVVGLLHHLTTGLANT